MEDKNMDRIFRGLIDKNHKIRQIITIKVVIHPIRNQVIFSRFVNEKTESTKEAYFKVDSRLLLQLGEQLVSNPAIALAELVKNAYDADATDVSVTLENVQDKTGGTITIKDNGLGISPDVRHKHG